MAQGGRIFDTILPPAGEPLGPYTAPYSEEAIQEAREAAESGRAGLYFDTLRAICETEGYDLRAFRRWLHRNGVKVREQSKRIWPKGYTQIVVNLSPEEKAVIDQCRDTAGQYVNRTEFVRRAVVHYIKTAVKQKEQHGTAIQI